MIKGAGPYFKIMLGILSNLLRRKRVTNDALLDRNSDEFRMQNPQFVSFLQKSGFRKRQLDQHEKTKRIKRFVTVACGWLLCAGLLWILIESAQALELF